MTTPQQSAHHVYSLLADALSTDSSCRRAAEQALRQAENEVDFFASLVQIATAPDEEVDPTIRWLAAVCGKNAVSRSWRRRVNLNAVTEDERAFVVHTLLSSIGEKHSNIATQLSVWLAAIGRLDFPRHWRSVVADLSDKAKTDDVTTLKHALSTLDMTLKSLESVRLRTDRVILQRYGPSTFSVLYTVFCARMTEWLSLRDEPNQQRARDVFQILVFCLKSLRRIIDFACGELVQLTALPELLQVFIHHQDYFVCARKGSTDAQRRLSLLAIKLVRVTHCRHPVAFQPYLSIFLQIYYQLVTSYETNVFDERICYHTVNFILNLLNAPDYRYDSANLQRYREKNNTSIQIPPGNTPEGCRILVISFFTQEVTVKLFQVFISKIFLLTADEIETWASDPETLVREEDACWGVSMLRKECEHLFKLLLSRDPEYLVPHIVQLTSSVPREQPLLLDACYRAVGIMGAHVRGHNAFDIDSCLEGPIAAILQSKCSKDLGERIIQARAAWLVGQFTERLSRKSRQMVYPWLVQLMAQQDYDRVIMLTATKSMQFLVDDLGFRGEDFAPYLEVCIQSCINLVKESESIETKRELMGTICNLVSACNPEVVAPVARKVALSIPSIWDDLGKTGRVSSHAQAGRADNVVNDNSPPNEDGGKSASNTEVLLQMDVVTLLDALVQKTGDLLLKQTDTRQILTAVLKYSLDASGGAGRIAMVPDACEFWLTVVMASDDYTNEFRELFPMTEKILGNDHDNLPVVFNIMKAYMLLGGVSFLQEFYSFVSQIVYNAVKSVVDRGLLAAADVTDLWLQTYTKDAVEPFGAVLNLMMEKIKDQSESVVVHSAFLAVLSRAALANVEKLGSIVFQNDESTCLELLDGIIRHLDTLPRLKGRRLGVLGLCLLVSRYRESLEVRRRVPGVLNGVAHVLGEEGKLESKREQIRRRADFEYDLSRHGHRDDTHVAPQADMNATLCGEVRLKSVQDLDVAKTMRVEDGCKEMLMSIRALGDGPYADALKYADPAITQQIQGAL